MISIRLVLLRVLVLILLATNIGLPLANDAQAASPANLFSDVYRFSLNRNPNVEGNPSVLFTAWMDVHFVNGGPGGANSVTASIVYAPANVTVIDGAVTLGNISSGGGAWSVDFFALKTDMTHPSDPNDMIIWQVEYDDAGGIHHTVRYVGKFPEDKVPHPNTTLTITSSSDVVHVGDKVMLTVKEQNTGDVSLTSPRVEVSPIGLNLAAPPTSGDNGNGILDASETWSWSVPSVTINATTTFTATGHGIDPLGFDTAPPVFPSEQASVTVKVIRPNTVVTITSSVPKVADCGSVVTLAITERNTGDVPLTTPRVKVSPIGKILGAPPASGDNGNGILDAGETWSWTVPNVAVKASTTFVATGHGFDPLGLDITYPAFPTEQTSVTVGVNKGSTRTPGFWQTHLYFTTYVFEKYLDSKINIGWKNITKMADLMGIFWAIPAKGSDGDKRDALSRAREITANQAVAAILNSGLPNGAPLPVSLSQIQTILGGTDIDAIQALGKRLDIHNNSGDNVDIQSPVPVGKATPQAARRIANISFAD